MSSGGVRASAFAVDGDPSVTKVSSFEERKQSGELKRFLQPTRPCRFRERLRNFPLSKLMEFRTLANCSQIDVRDCYYAL